MKFAVLGHPVSHSLSPVMQQTAFDALGIDATYEAIDVAPEDLEKFLPLARKTFAGFNVTIPHKEAIIPFLDVVDPIAMRARSVNTVINRGGCLTGLSTDGYGLQQAILEALNLDSLEGLSIGFIGAGGATRAVAHYLAMANVAHLVLLNRTLQKAHALAEQLVEARYKTEITTDALAQKDLLQKHLSQCDVIVQATALGLNPKDELPLNPEILPKSALIFDMIYWETPFLKKCREMGFKVCDGRNMLLYQGAKALQHWLDVPPPVDAMRTALNNAIRVRSC